MCRFVYNVFLFIVKRLLFAEYLMLMHCEYMYMYVFVSFLGSRIKTKIMEKTHQLYLFICLTTTLFTGKSKCKL